MYRIYAYIDPPHHPWPNVGMVICFFVHWSQAIYIFTWVLLLHLQAVSGVQRGDQGRGLRGERQRALGGEKYTAAVHGRMGLEPPEPM